MPSASEEFHFLGWHVSTSAQEGRSFPALETARHTLLILCLAAGLAEAGEQVAPTVVHTEPENGAWVVDTSTNESRVTFHQPMNSGPSFGGGSAFPEVIGQPKWITKTTIVLPVRLEPDREYRLRINSDRHRDFRGINGLSVAPYPLTFRTAPSGATDTPDSEPSRQSPEQLKSAIDTQYSHGDLQNADWNSIFDAFGSRLLAARTRTEFARPAGRAMGAVRDPHIWLEAEGERFGSFQTDAHPNAELSLLEGQIRGFRYFGPAVATRRFPGGPAYLMVASRDRQHARDIDAAAAWIDELRSELPLILDVSFNGGSDERLAAEFAGRFQQHYAVYARHRFRDASYPSRKELEKIGFSDIESRGVNPIRPGFRGHTVVLMGQSNMSTAEAFLLMMKQTPHCTLMGERSYGSSGNPRPVPLANGVSLFLPSWTAIAPDVFVPFPRKLRIRIT